MRGLERLVARLEEIAPSPGDTVEQLRSSHDAAVARMPPPGGVAFRPAQVGGMAAEWMIPNGSDAVFPAGRVVLYLHGGGYVIGSPASSRPLGSNLALAARAPLLCPDYRLAPEHPFPAAIDDAVAAVRWLRGRGHAASDIVLGGDSAGGGLAVAALVALRACGDPLPRAAFCLSPWSDLTLPAGSLDLAAPADPPVKRWLLAKMAALYLAGADPASPLASPVRADLRGLPPLLIHVGGGERLLDDGLALATAGRDAGVDITLERWDDMFHVWHAFAPRLPEAAQALASLGRWLTRVWA
jgi:acetyl esterase/lipase